MEQNRAATDPDPDVPDAPAPADPTVPIIITIAAILIAFYLVRLLGAPWPKFPVSFPDSFSYLKVARIGPLHGKFYFTERPIGYPLLMWLMGRSSLLVIVAQTLIYIAAFVLLAKFLCDELKSRVVAYIAVVFLVALAIELRNSEWNAVLLSESLALSTGVLSTALWLRAAGRPSVRSITWAWVGTGVWLLVRDTGVLPVITIIVPATLIIGFFAKLADKAIRRRLLVGAGVIVVLCGYVYVAQAVSLRNQYPMNNNVGMRILPDKQLTKFFVDGGMPLDDALRARTGHNSWDDGDQSFLTNPALAKYRTWARGPGTRRLFMSMAFEAPNWWKRFHKELPNILASNNREYDTSQSAQRLPRSMPAPLGEPRTTAGFWLWWLAAIAGIAATAFLGQRRKWLALFAGIGLLAAALEIYSSYVGDAMEVNRHLVIPLLRFNVFAVLAVAFGVDAIVTQLRTPRAPKPAPEAGGEPEGEPASSQHDTTLEEADVDA